MSGTSPMIRAEKQGHWCNQVCDNGVLCSFKAYEMNTYVWYQSNDKSRETRPLV